MSAQVPRTIAEVDAIIQRDPPPLDLLTSFEEGFARKSQVHRQLLHIKKLYGSHPKVDEFHNQRRAHYDANITSPNANKKYREGYESILTAISQSQGNVFGNGRVRRFLDLGFSPGGFSNCILKNNQGSVGFGITLPDDAASYRFEKYELLMDQTRFTPFFHDVVNITQQSLSTGTNPIDSLIAGNGHGMPRFDLIIADAFAVLAGGAPWYEHVRLALAQVYIVLLNLQDGGNAMFIIKTKPWKWQVEMLSILRRCFSSIQAVKGIMHKYRSTCYVVCKGFKRASPTDHSTIAQYVGDLRAVLGFLGEIARAGNDVNPETSMPSITGQSDQDLFNAEHSFVLGLMEHCWQDQYDAIRDGFYKVLEPGRGKSIHASSRLNLFR